MKFVETNHRLQIFVRFSLRVLQNSGTEISKVIPNDFTDEPDAPPCEYLDTEEQEMGHFDTEAGSFKSSVGKRPGER